MAKINLKDSFRKLSRSEMKNITGGYVSPGGGFGGIGVISIKPGTGTTPSCGEECTSDSFCQYNTSCPCCYSTSTAPATCGPR